jgi:hypothetical protein
MRRTGDARPGLTENKGFQASHFKGNHQIFPNFTLRPFKAEPIPNPQKIAARSFVCGDNPNKPRAHHPFARDRTPSVFHPKSVFQNPPSGGLCIRGDLECHALAKSKIRSSSDVSAASDLGERN